MTDKELQSRAESYAKEIVAKCYCGGDAFMSGEVKIYAANLVAFVKSLTADFCIVEKEQIYMRHGVARALMEQDSTHKEFYRGQSSVLESIFGSELFEEEGK